MEAKRSGKKKSYSTYLVYQNYHQIEKNSKMLTREREREREMGNKVYKKIKEIKHQFESLNRKQKG